MAHCSGLPQLKVNLSLPSLFCLSSTLTSNPLFPLFSLSQSYFTIGGNASTLPHHAGASCVGQECRSVEIEKRRRVGGSGT